MACPVARPLPETTHLPDLASFHSEAVPGVQGAGRRSKKCPMGDVCQCAPGPGVAAVAAAGAVAVGARGLRHAQLGDAMTRLRCPSVGDETGFFRRALPAFFGLAGSGKIPNELNESLCSIKQKNGFRLRRPAP